MQEISLRLYYFNTLQNAATCYFEYNGKFCSMLL